MHQALSDNSTMSQNRLTQLPGVHADALPAPAPLDRYAVLRSLDKERLREVAPDLARERLQRVVRVRDELRRGVFETPERLARTIERMLGVLDHSDRSREGHLS